MSDVGFWGFWFFSLVESDSILGISLATIYHLDFVWCMIITKSLMVHSTINKLQKGVISTHLFLFSAN